MELTRQLLYVCALWCFLYEVHSARISKEETSVPEDFSECGHSKKKVGIPKIIGGEDAALGSWPWMIALYVQSALDTRKQRADFVCGGTLISKQWIVTAGHCIHYLSGVNYFARLGDLHLYDRGKDGASPINVNFDRILVHPEYTREPIKNDIALAHMESPIDFTENIRPACLLSGKDHTNDNDYLYSETEAYITGWGCVNTTKRAYSHLQEAPVNIMPLEECDERYRRGVLDGATLIHKNVICAKGPSQNTCNGDSGGPLLLLNNTEKRFYLGGITSFGVPGNQSYYPGVFTRVAKYIPWINDVTGENF